MLLAEFRKRVGPEIEVELEKVSEIPRTSSGKFKWVISKIPMSFKQGE
jgi:phenylacetate-coenzyme A ligase PaaK-like adenylate-forming protein